MELSQITLQLGFDSHFIDIRVTYEDGNTYLAVWYLDIRNLAISNHTKYYLVICTVTFQMSKFACYLGDQYQQMSEFSMKIHI